MVPFGEDSESYSSDKTPRILVERDSFFWGYNIGLRSVEFIIYAVFLLWTVQHIVLFLIKK